MRLHPARQITRQLSGSFVAEIRSLATQLTCRARTGPIGTRQTIGHTAAV